MKVRISATIDSETDKILRKIVEKHRYRNMSHAIEEIILSYWENEVKKK